MTRGAAGASDARHSTICAAGRAVTAPLTSPDLTALVQTLLLCEHGSNRLTSGRVGGGPAPHTQVRWPVCAGAVLLGRPGKCRGPGQRPTNARLEKTGRSSLRCLKNVETARGPKAKETKDTLRPPWLYK